MTKRRAEGGIYHDSPHKRLCFQSLCNNDTALRSLQIVEDADAPSLLSFLTSHCRKRNYLDDAETTEWSRSRKKSFKTKNSCTTLTDYENSGRLREACVQSQEATSKKRPREETQQEGTEHIRNVNKHQASHFLLTSFHEIIANKHLLKECNLQYKSHDVAEVLLLKCLN